jgi:hypothetical protein
MKGDDRMTDSIKEVMKEKRVIYTQNNKYFYRDRFSDEVCGPFDSELIALEDLKQREWRVANELKLNWLDKRRS